MKWLCSAGIAVSLALQSALADDLFGNHPLTPEARNAFVTELLKKMTVDEKVNQPRLISVGPNNPKEVIREMTKDGQVGAVPSTITRQDIRAIRDQVTKLSRLKILLFFAYDVLHGWRMVFPISFGLAPPFNLNVMKTVGCVSAYEAADDGLDMTWALMVDVLRDPRWGRASEGFGEDTYLISTMGKTMVETMQGRGPVDCYSMVTSVKHFAAYGAVESGKEYNTVGMSPRRLFNDYMPPYKAGLDTGSDAVIVALNSPDDVPTTPDSWLPKDVLRDQQGFEDVTASDYGATREPIRHGTVTDPEDAVRAVLKSGTNMSMSDEYYSKYLPELIKSGKVMMEELDDAACHVLNVKYDMGLFNDPCSHLGPKELNPVDTNVEGRLYRKEAREAARESLVLLKSRLEALLLRESATIAVVGPLADSKRDVMGSWSTTGVAGQSVTILTGIKNSVGENGGVLYAKGASVTSDEGIIDPLNQYEEAVRVDPRSPQEMTDGVVRTAKQSSVVVAITGEAQGVAHEASSRTDITIPQSQRDLTVALKTTGKLLVLVLMNGRSLALIKENQQASAILGAWFAGTESSNAITDVLFGDYDSSSKPPMSFPHSAGQIPVYYSHLDTGCPYSADKPNEYTSRYFDKANGALCPFGCGLSYTTPTVSNVKLSVPIMKRDGKVTVNVQITDTSKHEGVMVMQMYLQDVAASMSRPVEQLRGFEKVALGPSGTQTVSFLIDIEALKLWNQQTKYNAEPGRFSIPVGTDSVRIKKGEFELL